MRIMIWVAAIASLAACGRNLSNDAKSSAQPLTRSLQNRRSCGQGFTCRNTAAQDEPLPDELRPYPFVANITFPEGPAFDRQGNLYFVNYARNGTIGRMTPDGTVSVWATLPGAYPLGLKVDADGYVYSTDLTGKRILRVS